MNSFSAFYVAAMVSLLVCCAGGCGPEKAAVKGRVTAGGKPVTRGTIIFAPANAKEAAQSSTGAIQSDGSFELSGGAVIGMHKVTVTGEQVLGAEGDEDDEEQDDDESFAAVVNSLTGTATVKTGENDLTVDLTRQKGTGAPARARVGR